MCCTLNIWLVSTYKGRRPGLSFTLSVSAGAEPSANCCVGQLVILRLPTNPAQMTSPGPPRLTPAGRGAWMIRLLGRLTLQLSKNQFPVLLEYAKASFERIK